MKQIIRILFLVIIFLAGYQQVMAQQVAVKTNGLMLLGGIPNVGFEVVTGERTSLDLSGFVGYKPYKQDLKLVGFQPEFRYWFNGRPMVREYVGISALAASYNITWGKNVYNGDAGGLGLTIGYSLNIKKRLNIEFYGGFGAVLFRHKQYNVHDNLQDYAAEGLEKVNAHGYKLLPTKLGVSVSYIIK